MALWTPTNNDVDRAAKHVAWEYVSMLAAAWQMAEGHGTPLNHQVQESFLVHVRNLAEFFCKGAFVQRDRKRMDNIYAVDFCTGISWDPSPLQSQTKLRRAIDKTLSHLTYARDMAGPDVQDRFEGYLHGHGTVTLLRRTWADFWKSVPLPLQTRLTNELRNFAIGLGLDPNDMAANFERCVHQRIAAGEKWELNMTPDGSAAQHTSL